MQLLEQPTLGASFTCFKRALSEGVTTARAIFTEREAMGKGEVEEAGEGEGGGTAAMVTGQMHRRLGSGTHAPPLWPWAWHCVHCWPTRLA